jgi:NAD(P)-dependent dehydrogenase (short-subunit alcohol dehydrogenase family)
MNTVLITGCSSGFGLETARLFHQNGWRVIATMREVRKSLLPDSDRILVLPLDITSAESISVATAQVGPVDAIVNNAGIGAVGPLEGMSPDTIQRLFLTNALGTISMTRAVLPHLRSRNGGVIVNISSIVTARPLPLLSVYSASKAAVDAFSASFALEVQPFNVRVHLVQPGRAPATKFGENARLHAPSEVPEPYAAFSASAIAEMRKDTDITVPVDVAAAVWRAVMEPSSPFRIPV